MLSRVEQQYLKSPTTFRADYQRILRYRIRHKVQRIKALLPLLEARGFCVMNNCNGVTDYCNGQQSLNQAAFKDCTKPRAGIEPATAALPRRCPTRLGYRGAGFMKRA